MNRRSGKVAIGLVAAVAGALASGDAEAATINWKGHTWQVTSGGMAGVCQGSPANVTIDANGYLHFRISNAGGTWTASEIFTTDKLAFGTYQWQVDGPIDTYDKNVVLGLFPYGPAAGIGSDGTNEIDIEYARWGVANGPNGDWTDYPASGMTIGELSYTFSLGGSTLSTSRFVWTKTSITSSLLGGIQPVGGNGSLIKTWTYMPSNPTVNIPQQALPLGMNLWCFDAPPSDGQPVEIIVRDFTFVPEGAGGAGGGGAGGAAGNGGAGGRGGNSGRRGARWWRWRRWWWPRRGWRERRNGRSRRSGRKWDRRHERRRSWRRRCGRRGCDRSCGHDGYGRRGRWWRWCGWNGGWWERREKWRWGGGRIGRSRDGDRGDGSDGRLGGSGHRDRGDGGDGRLWRRGHDDHGDGRLGSDGRLGPDGRRRRVGQPRRGWKRLRVLGARRR